MMVGWLEVRQS